MKFREELQHLINRHSIENGSDTPDFILADFFEDILLAFERATIKRDAWYGRKKIKKNQITTRSSVPAAPDAEL